MKQVLALSHVRKSYDGKVVLDDVKLAFLPGAKIGVVGPNGMGKSTLLTMMVGLEQPSNGGNLLLLDEPATTWTWRPWPRWRKHCSSSPAAP